MNTFYELVFIATNRLYYSAMMFFFLLIFTTRLFFYFNRIATCKIKNKEFIIAFVGYYFEECSSHDCSN